MESMMPTVTPIRGSEGADIIGPRNADRERQNPFTVRSPTSDHGTMPNLKWSFADSHMRIEEGGWAREVTVRELPISKAMAGVNMRLKAGGVRELHWHKEAEWSYMLKGKARITVVDELGRSRTTSARGIFGTSRPASHIRSRDWTAISTVANSCSSNDLRIRRNLATTYIMLPDPLSSYTSGTTVAVTGGKPFI